METKILSSQIYSLVTAFIFMTLKQERLTHIFEPNDLTKTEYRKIP